jgi:hypothetical protein
MTTSSIINPKQTFGVDAANAHYVRLAAVGLSSSELLLSLHMRLQTHIHYRFALYLATRW